MPREHRSTRVAVVAPDDTPGRFEAVVLRYGVVDDYGTRFRPKCFTASLEERLPRICWSHDWSEPIGRWVDYRDTDTELTLVGELDDFDAVPRARQAYAQLRSGTIDQFSVGFLRTGDEKASDGVVDITGGVLDEVSLVLVGAVPGTSLVSVRTAAGAVAEDLLVALARKVVAGEMSQAEAEKVLELAAGRPPAAECDPEETEDPPTVEEELAVIVGEHPDLVDVLDRWA